MKRYWLASRPYSLTAALVPVLLGTGLAKLLNPSLKLSWLDFFLTLLGCVGAQAVSNLANDLADSKYGIDDDKTVGRHNALVAKTMTWSEMFWLTAVVGAVSALIGAYLIFIEKAPVAVIAIVGAVLAVEYTAPPLKLKYRALGDLAVLVAFGLGMVFGAYIVQAHRITGWNDPQKLAVVLLYSLPSASLVVAILHANNHRDRETDVKKGGRTVASSLSFKASKNLLIGLLVGPFVFVIVAAVSGLFTLATLLILLSVPPLLKLLQPIRNDRYERSVPSIAKLNGQFGLLMAVAILVQIYLSARGAKTG